MPAANNGPEIGRCAEGFHTNMELSPQRADQLILSSCAMLRATLLTACPPPSQRLAQGCGIQFPVATPQSPMGTMTRRGTMTRIFLENASTFHLLVVPLVQDAWSYCEANMRYRVSQGSANFTPGQHNNNASQKQKNKSISTDRDRIKDTVFGINLCCVGGKL